MDTKYTTREITEKDAGIIIGPDGLVHILIPKSFIEDGDSPTNAKIVANILKLLEIDSGTDFVPNDVLEDFYTTLGERGWTVGDLAIKQPASMLK